MLEARGVRAVNPSMGFPMEMDHSPAKRLGRLAQADRGRGGPGPHGHPPQRHPPAVRQLRPARHGPDRRRGRRLRPARIDYNPCLECKLCVAACPVGAIAPDGHFQLLGLLHAQLPGVPGRLLRLGRADRRRARRPGLPPAVSTSPRRPRCGRASASGRTTSRPTAWPSARPARTSSAPISPTRRGICKEVVKPLQEKAGDGLRRRRLRRRGDRAPQFKNKTVKPVGNGLRPRTIGGLLTLHAVRFPAEPVDRARTPSSISRFTGMETREATVTIRNRTIDVQRRPQRQGRPARDRRRQDVARLPGGGEEPAVRH